MMYKAMTIAGSDTSGGAGMEADLKTFQEMGVYGMTALTCIVAQNPNADWAHEIYPIEESVIEKQLATILQGIGCDAMKTGMLGSAELVELVARTIDKYELKNVVIDPVMVCKGIDTIMVPEAAAATKELLIKRALVMTPNLLEAAYLADMPSITNVDDMKQALGALNWAYGIITQLEKEYGAKIRKNPSEKATQIQKQAYGRIASVVNKIKKDLDFLDFAKQNLRNMPTIDFDATTIVIAGFPNVGKSTLLTQLSSADPQVANYPFTTKGIQIGHTEIHWRSIQIIDTPGLLDRPVLEMNDIEMNAIVALEHLADAILFIFDASETCGFHLENQYNLLKQIEKIFSEIPVYYLFNKMDLVEDREYLKEYIDDEDHSIFISAIEGDGIDEINKVIRRIKKIERDFEPEDDDEYY